MSEANADWRRQAVDGGKWALLYAVLAMAVLSIVLAAVFTALHWGLVP